MIELGKSMDSYKAASDMGIKLRKKWLATRDERTRDSHASINGEVVDWDKPFSNGLMFPGDPSGPAAEVYNCRCALVAVDVGFAERGTAGSYRKEKNTGALSEYTELATLQNIKRVIKDVGADYTGAKIRIDRSENMIGTGICGYTSGEGDAVTFFADAFADREQLVKTVAHESIHLKQARKHGKTVTSDDLIAREKEAMEAEDEAWRKYKKSKYHK